MSNINNQYTISEYLISVEGAPKTASFLNSIIEGGQKFIAQTMQKSAEARLKTYYSRRLQKQLNQDTPEMVPMEMKLRMGFHRS